MKNIKNIALATAGLGLLGYNNMVGALDVTGGTDTSRIEGGTTPLPQLIVNWIGWLATFLYTIAVVIGLWGGFQILTAGQDEEKVKNGKTTIINAVIGLIVIFLASTVMRFIIEQLFVNQ